VQNTKFRLSHFCFPYLCFNELVTLTNKPKCVVVYQSNLQRRHSQTLFMIARDGRPGMARCHGNRQTVVAKRRGAVAFIQGR
jgi:hypothetical protein